MTDRAKRFVRANDKSLVVSGAAQHEGGEGPEFLTGCAYMLENNQRFVLTTEDCRALPEGYPKWLL